MITIIKRVVTGVGEFVSSSLASAAGSLRTIPLSFFIPRDGATETNPGEWTMLQSAAYGEILVRGSEPTDFGVVVPHDSTAMDAPYGLWVGTGGHVTGRLKNSSGTITLKNVPSGSFVPGWWVLVTTATTAQDIVAFQRD